MKHGCCCSFLKVFTEHLTPISTDIQREIPHIIATTVPLDLLIISFNPAFKRLTSQLVD